MEGNENSVIPTIAVELSKLPSRGVPYAKSASLSYRTYTFGEVRESSTSSFDTVKSLRKTLSGLVCSNLDPYQLTVEDALYLGIMRKVSTFHGMDLEIPFICAKCEQGSKGVITENKLTFTDMDKAVTKLPLVAPIGGKDYKFRPMTVKQFIDFSEGRYRKTLNSDKISETAIHAAYIQDIPFEESFKMVSSLTDQDDMEMLFEISKLFKHDLDRIELKCNDDKCGHVNRVRLEGREALLRPFRNRKSSVRDRICFGEPPVNEPCADGPDGVQPSNAIEPSTV